IGQPVKGEFDEPADGLGWPLLRWSL
ncbi:MAG: hypothetical protein QOK26_1518, partial [Pseudonocardiales bacterium]|nr:hypothetical protein [Pseudonocardiales bacterium]